MYARVVSAQVDPEQLEHVVEIVRKDSLRESREHPGFRGAYGLVDRSTGRGMLITLWESAADIELVEASGYLAHTLSYVMGHLHGPAIRETYEVAFEA